MTPATVRFSHGSGDPDAKDAGREPRGMAVKFYLGGRAQTDIVSINQPVFITRTPEEFLDLNTRVGGWKRTGEMVTEGFPFAGDFSLDNFDPWSSRQMNLSPDDGVTPAPRTEGDITAMNAAYESGMVFDGTIDIPVIDCRPYLERELDMHHSHQSFATHQRIIDRQGDAGNQVIWFTDADPAVAFDQTPMAFEVIDEWMANLRANPALGVAGNKPPRAVDRCFDNTGAEIASGGHVWDGILDSAPPGACTVPTCTPGPVKSSSSCGETAAARVEEEPPRVIAVGKSATSFARPKSSTFA